MADWFRALDERSGVWKSFAEVLWNDALCPEILCFDDILAADSLNQELAATEPAAVSGAQAVVLTANYKVSRIRCIFGVFVPEVALETQLAGEHLRLIRLAVGCLEHPAALLALRLDSKLGNSLLLRIYTSIDRRPWASIVVGFNVSSLVVNEFRYGIV